VDPESILDNIMYARAVNSEVIKPKNLDSWNTHADNEQHQSELLNVLGEHFKGGLYRLLIIDSIMNCFRVDFCGRGELADRQQKLNVYLHRLVEIAERRLPHDKGLG